MKNLPVGQSEELKESFFVHSAEYTKLELSKQLKKFIEQDAQVFINKHN